MGGLTECIEWGGAINSSGYGVTWQNGKIEYVHRLAVNALPTEVVMHTCDNKKCFNPFHLVKGTPKDNSYDMVQKGRQARGEQAGNSKLNEINISFIKGLKGFATTRNLAQCFNVSKTTISDIWKGTTWNHIK